MPLRSFIFVTLSLLVLAEIGIVGWRHRGIQLAQGPVFRYPLAEESFGSTGQIVTATEIYQADRGAEFRLVAEGHAATVFYFEWDRVAASPVMGLASHGPEMCNVPAGFVLLGRGDRRVHEVPGKPPLIFESTSFKTPAGQPMHVFKLAWMQDLGSLELTPGKDRLTRLRLSLQPKLGAARVLQAGVEGPADEEQAWQIVRSEVLGQIAWN